MQFRLKQIEFLVITALVVIAVCSSANAALNTSVVGIGWSDSGTVSAATPEMLPATETKSVPGIPPAIQGEVVLFTMPQGGMTSPIPSQSQVTPTIAAIPSSPFGRCGLESSGTVVDPGEQFVPIAPAEKMLDPPRAGGC